jgi:hypothetical protein
MTSARRGIEEYFLDRDAAAEVSAGGAGGAGGDGAGGSVGSKPKVDSVMTGGACTIRRDT